MYLAYNAHAPYCYLWPVRLHNIFRHYLINGMIFGGKKYHEMSVLIFSTNFVWIISHCKKTKARYIINVYLSSCTVPVYAERSRHSDWLRAGRSEDRIPVGARFSAPVQTGPGAYPASCTMGTGSFPGVKSGRDVTLTPHFLPVPWSWKSRALSLLPLWV